MMLKLVLSLLLTVYSNIGFASADEEISSVIRQHLSKYCPENMDISLLDNEIIKSDLPNFRPIIKKNDYQVTIELLNCNLCSRYTYWVRDEDGHAKVITYASHCQPE